MTVIARRIASIPVRLASETWETIVDLLAPSEASVRQELLGVTGVAASLITKETIKDSPVIVAGSGPRLRFYCVYGEKAIEGTGVSEASLPSSPTDPDTWILSLPCPADDLKWVQASLEKVSSRISARDMSEQSLPEPEEEAPEARATINRETFLRP